MPIEIADEVVASVDCMSMATILAIREHEDLVESFVASLDSSYQYRLDQYWILIHEINRRGKLPYDDRLVEYVKSTGLELLKQEEVSFMAEPEPLALEEEEPVDWLDI
ncbi:MAG: hypothetical protein IPI29_04150 [Ignavibacteria bacterium]|nr:hypothetical protein [Ignavibacteria bacterium]